MTALSARSCSKRHWRVAARIELAVFSGLFVTFFSSFFWGKKLVYNLKRRLSWSIFSRLQNRLEIGQWWGLRSLYSLFSLLLLISNRFPNLMIISKSVTAFHSWIRLPKTQNFFHFFIISIGSNFESLSFSWSLEFISLFLAIVRLV